MLRRVPPPRTFHRSLALLSTCNRRIDAPKTTFKDGICHDAGESKFRSYNFDALDLRTRYRILCSAITPRPIAWISTVDEDGINNVAPLSFFMPVTSDPPTLALSLTTKKSGRWKDTLRNIICTREFVVNHVTTGAFAQMYETSKEFDPEIDEFSVAKLTPMPSDQVAAPRIMESPIQLECKLLNLIPVGDSTKYGSSTVVIGKILITHLQDSLVNEHADGSVTIHDLSLETVARMGGLEYGTIGTRWNVEQDKNWNENHW